ncbi:MAG: hypothetical protein ACPG52_09205 [Cognaticolwellia sp.]
MSSKLLYAQEVIRYHVSESYHDPKQAYYVDLLKLILDASRNSYGGYQLLPVKLDMPRARSSSMLQKGRLIDITWRMTSPALEQDLRAVYMPLVKGLMGVRIAIIRRGTESKFSPNITLSQLKQLPVGQGHGWLDSEILAANGFNIVEGSAATMLTMLERERFDYFPRAIHEPWIEIFDKPQFTVEESFVLRYPAPIYFFTNKANKRLTNRIQDGFASIIASGAFEQHFLQHPITKNILEKAKLSERKVFTLHNPLLTEKTRLALSSQPLWRDYGH